MLRQPDPGMKLLVTDAYVDLHIDTPTSKIRQHWSTIHLEVFIKLKN